MISCDRTTIFRYESGKTKPDPDIMYKICEILGDVDVWSKWMRTEFPRSYGLMHPETVEYSLSGALLLMYAEISDVVVLQRDVMLDGADEHISDVQLARNLSKEIEALIGSAQRVRTLIDQELKSKES